MTTKDSLSRLTDAELLIEVRRLASVERDATVDLIRSLCEVEARQLHLSIGCSSMFDYCTRVLRLSEHAAYARIAAARAASRFPIVVDLLAEGAITLTTVTLLRKHLTAENHVAVLESAKRKRKAEVEMIVATLRPRPEVETSICGTLNPANVHAVSPERYTLTMTISAETRAKLVRARELLWHTSEGRDEAAIIDRALTVLIAQLEKTKFAKTDRPRQAREFDPSTRHVPAQVRREVSERDRYQCAFLGSEGRCPETAGLEYHHRIPFADGGPTTVDNLELRCRAHNTYEAEQWFGPLFVRETCVEWSGLGLDQVPCRLRGHHAMASV
jgi:hypothetical protein